MAKQRRVTETRTIRKKSNGRSSKAPQTKRPVATAVAPRKADELSPASVPAPPPKKPAYYEAISLYETGVRALQKHDFAAAANQFRSVIQGYPEERELLERARLYLRVCERETANRPTGPKTPDERVYAATVALNAGDADAALAQLRQALVESPNHDHGHYIMAVALCEKGDLGGAVAHLRKAVDLNPDNRANARQDPDLTPIRDLPDFRGMLESEDPSRRRQRNRKA